MNNISFLPLYVNNTYLPSLVIRHLTDVSNAAIYRRFGNAVQVTPYPLNLQYIYQHENFSSTVCPLYNLTEIIPYGIL